MDVLREEASKTQVRLSHNAYHECSHDSSTQASEFFVAPYLPGVSIVKLGVLSYFIADAIGS